MSLAPCDQVQTPVAADFPEKPLSNAALPVVASQIPTISNPEQPLVAQAESVCLYDWVRRGGAQVNVQALVDMFKTSSFAQVSGPCIHSYEFNTQSGTINYSVLLPQNGTTDRVSQNQWQAVSGGAV